MPPKSKAGKKKVKLGSLASKPAKQPTNDKYVTTKAPKSGGSVGALAKYLCAINDPFCMAAEGARVPDEYSFPTEAVTCRLKFTWVPTAAGAETLVFIPDPRISAVLFAGAGSATTTMAIAGAGITGTIPVSSIAGRINTLNYGGAVTASALETRTTKFRVVGWGVRIRCVTAASSVAGDLTVALTPCGSYIPATLGAPCGVTSAAEATPLQAAGGWNEPQEAFGIPYSSNNASVSPNYNHPVVTSLETLPVSEVLSAAELAQTGGICIKPRLCSAEAFSWRNPSAMGTGFGLGYSSAVTPGGAAAGSGFITPSAMHIGGHNAISVQSVPTGSQTYEFEVVYHLECQPNTISGAGGLGHSASASPVVTRASVDSILARANASPFIDFVKHEGSRAIGNMTKALPGLITKAAIMALA